MMTVAFSAYASEIWREEFNDSVIAGVAKGLTYVTTPTGKGAEFKRESESRVQYPYSSGMPTSGTIEIKIKVDSAYQYRDYKVSTDEQCALVFTTDVGGGDVTYPGSAWFYACKNGDVSLSIATAKYGSKPHQTLVKTATAFRFGEWHTISYSFGSGGQAIAVDGEEVALNAKNTQILGAGGDHSSPKDTPTLSESQPGFWSNNQWDGGFEGVVDTFRVSSDPRDWQLFTPYAEGCWSQKTDVPFASAREPLSVVINSRGYVGVDSDFYEYRPLTDKWTKKANLPNGFTFQAPTFELFDQAYVIIGTQVWTFSPYTGKWSKKKNIPSADMRAAFAFSGNGKGFAGGGFYNGAAFWSYNWKLDSWKRLSDLPPDLADCIDCSGFVIGTNAYVTGTNNSFWQYDIKKDKWNEKAYVDAVYGKAFAIGEIGYVINTHGSIFKYNESNNSWSLISNLPGQAVCYPSVFAMDGRMFVSMGGKFADRTCTLEPSSAVWQYVPKELCGQ